MQAVRSHAYDAWVARKQNLARLRLDEQAYPESVRRKAEATGLPTSWRSLALLLLAVNSATSYSFVAPGPSRGLFSSAPGSWQNDGLHDPSRAKTLAWRTAKRFRIPPKMYENRDLLSDLRTLIKEAQENEAKADELEQLERVLHGSNIGFTLLDLRAEEANARGDAVTAAKLQSQKEKAGGGPVTAAKKKETQQEKAQRLAATVAAMKAQMEKLQMEEAQKEKAATVPQMEKAQIDTAPVEEVAKTKTDEARLKEEGYITTNEAGFSVGATMSPEDADRLGVKAFGDGGYEQEGTDMPKKYTHGPNADPMLSGAFVVPCMHWRSADAEEKEKLAAQALAKLRDFGFVVLESLFSVDEISQLEKAAPSTCLAPQPGLIPQRLRADRFEAPIPYTAPWSSDWLYRNDLVLEVAARYLQNNLAAGRTKDEQQDGMVQWIDNSSADLDFFSDPQWGPKRGPLLDNPPSGCSNVGNVDERGAFFGGTSMIYAPARGPSQQRHRDIIFPGAGAVLNVQVAITPLTGDNGPVALMPGSHRMNKPPFEIVACPPPGSLVLYDSFTEHRGIANSSPNDRFALYYYFSTRGVNTGYQVNHFGPESDAQMKEFRRLVDPALRPWVEGVGNA